MLLRQAAFLVVVVVAIVAIVAILVVVGAVVVVVDAVVVVRRLPRARRPIDRAWLFPHSFSCCILVGLEYERPV